MATHLLAFKDTDTSKTSDTTLANDPDLVLSSLDPNSIYTFTGMLLVGTGTEINFDFTSVIGHVTVWGIAHSGNMGYTASLTSDFQGLTGGGGLGDAYWLRGWLDTSGSSVAFAIRWAQRTSSGTASVLKEGSWLHAVQIA